MKQIIVPTDFSETAKHAYYYAQELALYMDAKIKVIHISNPPRDPSSPYFGTSPKEFQKMRRQLLDDYLEELTETTSPLSNIATGTVTREVISGSVTDVLINLSKDQNVDLIVMGTKGKGKVLGGIFGSTSSFFAKKTQCPVLFVPENVLFSNFRNILYASNYESANSKTLNQIADFAALFPATIHLAHINESQNKGNTQLEELVLEKLFHQKAPQLDLKMTTLDSDNVWEGLQLFADKMDVNLIVLAKPNRGFWNNLFHSSLTRKMVGQSKYPILVLPI